MGKDLRESPEYAAVAEHLRRLHEPAFGRPHNVTDIVATADASRIVVAGSVFDELEGLPRTALYEVRDGGLHALTSGGGSAKAGSRRTGRRSPSCPTGPRPRCSSSTCWAAGSSGRPGPRPRCPARPSSWPGHRTAPGSCSASPGLGAEISDAQGSGNGRRGRLRAAVLVPGGGERDAGGRVAQPVGLHAGYRRAREGLAGRAERVGGGLVRPRARAGHHQREARRGRLVLRGAEPARHRAPVR